MNFNELNKKENDEPKQETTKSEKKVSVKKITRQREIKNCDKEDCNGNPVLVDFEVTNFIGKRCERCYLIAHYERS